MKFKLFFFSALLCLASFTQARTVTMTSAECLSTDAPGFTAYLTMAFPTYKMIKAVVKDSKTSREIEFGCTFGNHRWLCKGLTSARENINLSVDFSWDNIIGTMLMWDEKGFDTFFKCTNFKSHNVQVLRPEF